MKVRRRRPPPPRLGLIVDRLAGEPPASVHPVAVFGTVMDASSERLYRDSRRAGGGVHRDRLHDRVRPPARSSASSIVVAGAAAGRSLRETACDVRDALVADDLDGARARVPALVGRDPSALDRRGLSAAVIESVAENTVDAVVAPACWAALGRRSGRRPSYRALNTMDAMVGHRSPRYERFGWARRPPR